MLGLPVSQNMLPVSQNILSSKIYRALIKTYFKVVEMCKQGYYINTLFPLSKAVSATFVQMVKQLCKSFSKKRSWK